MRSSDLVRLQALERKVNDLASRLAKLARAATGDRDRLSGLWSGQAGPRDENIPRMALAKSPALGVNAGDVGEFTLYEDDDETLSDTVVDGKNPYTDEDVPGSRKTWLCQIKRDTEWRVVNWECEAE